MPDTTIVRHPCGCQTHTHPVWGVKHSLSKCSKHQSRAVPPAALPLSYFTDDLHAAPGGCPRHKAYIDELLDPLNENEVTIPWGTLNKSRALEIGCGLGMYAPLFMSRGYIYEGVEPAKAAADWVMNTFNVWVTCTTFEAYTAPVYYDAIIAAHVLEHFEDSPGMIAKMSSIMVPGGRIYIIVPDDSDMVNPDHLWFYTRQTLTDVLKANGFGRVSTNTRRRVAHENFIYASALKE